MNYAEINIELNELIDKYRNVCFWFAPQDYYPKTKIQMKQALRHLKTNGDLDAFQKAKKMEKWL